MKLQLKLVLCFDQILLTCPVPSSASLTWNASFQIDHTLFSFAVEGAPEQPANPSYIGVDGDFQDTSRIWTH